MERRCPQFKMPSTTEPKSSKNPYAIVRSVESPTHPYPDNEGHKQEISAVLTVTFATVWGVFDSAGPVFNYSIMLQNQIIVESYCCNKGYLTYTST